MRFRKLQQHHCHQILSPGCSGNSSGKRTINQRSVQRVGVTYLGLYPAPEWCCVRRFASKTFLLDWGMGVLYSHGEKVGSQEGISSGSKRLCLYNRMEYNSQD